MSVAIIDKNSKLGIALAEKRRKKQYGEETSAVTSAPSEQASDTAVEISRNSKLGQYLAGNANAMFSNIAKSAAEKSGEYEQTSKNFNSWAKANEKFINDRDGAKKYSDTFRQYADGIDRQLNRLRSLGVKSGDNLYDSLEEQKKYFTSNLDWLNNMSQYKNKIQAAIGTTDDVMNYSAPALRNALRRNQGLPYLSEDEFNAELKKRNDRLIADIDTAVKNKRKLNGEKFSADELENYPDYIKELLRKRKDAYASNIQIEVPYGKTAEEYSAFISDYDAQIEEAKANGGTGNVLADTARRALIHNGTLRKQGDEASEKLKALQHKKALAEKYRDIAAVNRIKGSEDEALFKELDELGWQNQGQRVRNLFAGATGNINPDMGTQYNENLKRIEEIKAVLRSKGYDTDAYINAYHKATNAETAEEIRKDAAEFAKNHPVIGGIALPVAANFASGAANLVGYAMGESGQDSPYNFLGNIRNASVESRAAAIEANHIKEDGTVNSLGKVLSTLYRAAESSLESITLNKAFGKGAELIMSLNAAADTYNTAVDDGLDFPNAFATAFSAGVFEAFFEHISLEKLRYFDQNPAAYNDVLGNIKNLLKGFFTEGSEEVFTDIANSFTDYLINGGLSEYERFKAEGGTASEFAKQKGADILQSFIVGGLSGAMFTGAGITRNVAANVGANTETGNDIRRGIKAGELSIYDVAEAKNHISQDSDAAQYLGAIDTNADVYKTGKKPLSPKWYKAGRAYNEAGRQSVADTANAVQRLTKGEITDSEYLDTVDRAGNIAKISEQINLASRKASKKEQRRMKEAEEREAQRKAKIEQADRRIEADGAKINKAVRSGNTAKLVKNRSEGVRSDGLDVSLGAVTGVENGRISVEFDPDTHAVAAFDASGAETVTDDGSAAKTVKASSPEINALYEGINRAVTGTVEADSGTDVTGRTVNTGAKMSVNAANLALSMYNETANADASVYTRIMYETYKAGKRGLPFETLRESIAAEYDIGAYDGTVTGTQIKQMYKAGASEFEARPGVQRIGVKSVTTGEHKNVLTQLSAIDLFAKKHGISIIAVDSLTDAEGNAINGEYRTGNNIVISLDADGGLYMPVVGHEIFHYAESINAEDAKALAELIIDTLKASKGAEWLEARRREYAGYGYKDGGIDSEIAADFFGAAVTQKEFERQIKTAELNKSFAQKIIEKVKEVVAELKEIMQKLRGQRLIYDAALDTDAETLDFFVNNLERILNQAGTETKNTAENSGAKRQNSIENKAAYGTAQTKLTKEYRAAVDRVLNMQDTTADNLVIGYTPELMKDMGMPALPFVIGTGHVYSAAKTEAEARKDGNYRKGVHYHGLGDTVVKNIYEQLQDPVMIIAAKDVNGNASPLRSTHSVVAIVDIGTANNSLLLPVEITAERTVDGQQMDANVLSSVYDRNVKNLIKEAIALENSGDVGIYYAKKEAAALIPAGVRFPIRIQKAIASNPIVRSFDEKVNRKISDVTQSLQFKRWFGDWQNHPENASKIVNADGTPKVVYHQTDADFTVFNTDNQRAGKLDTDTPTGMFFKPTDQNIGINGTKQMPVYLNARNILELKNRDEAHRYWMQNVPGYAKLQAQYDAVDTKYNKRYEEAENISDEWYDKNYDDLVSGKISDEEALRVMDEPLDKILKEWKSKTEPIAIKQKQLITDFIKNSSYDGIHLSYDGRRNGVDVETFIVFDPTQIKSATDNIGTFDGTNPDIRFQRKLPDVQEKLKKMSGSDDIDDVKRMAYGLADDFMKYAKAARLEMTETRGLMPQSTRVSEIVAKYNDYRKTGISNKQLESDITDIFTDYMNGVGSSGTLFNYITDTIMKRELNSYEVIGDETFKAVRAYTDGGRFKVSDATVGSLVDTFGSLGEINGILRENYGFTIAKETDARAENRAVWAPVGAQLAEEAGHVFDGTDYTENAKGGFEYETLASLLQTAQNDPRIYRGWLTGANTPDERILAQDELADRVEEEALKMYGELMSAPARNTKADRYRKMLFDYSVKHAAQLDRLENRLAENKLRVEELKAENRAKMQELRGTKNEEIETVKQAYRERIKTQRAKRNETASKAKVRSQITKRVKVLNALLTRETDAKHIPQELKHTVAEFLLPFTEDSSVFGKAKDDVLSLERYVRMNDLLTDIYNATEGDSADGAALNERYRSLAGNLDGDLVRDFGEMRRTMAGKRLSQLSLDELQTVNKIVVNIANMVKQGRETFINGKKESLDEIGRETVSDLTSRRQRRKHLKPVDWAIDLMNDKETTPIYFFGEKLGGFFGQIYGDIRDAQDKWYVRCAEAQRAIEDLQEKYNFKKWAGKADKGVTFTLDDGGTVTLTKEQILSIYATAKRERTGGNNTTHVFDGGIVVDDELRRGLKDKISTALAQRSEKGKKAFSDAFSEQIRSEARHLTVNDLARITAALTDEQKAYADSVVGLLSTTVGGWGNETSMEMYGFKKFTEDYYFPVMSDKSYLYTRFGISDDTRLKHAGFTNKVVRGANNPIIITGFTNVAAGHINQMALYSSFTVPIENMTKLYNYELSPTEDADGHTVRGMSVKKALTNAYGKAANEYIADFMRALNGGIKADSVENFLDWGTSKFKRAAVMANLSVIVQQPSAIARATALINPKYLVGFSKETLPKTVAEMYKYSAVAGIKKLGGFDTGTGMSVTQWISNSEQSFSEKASDLLGKGAEKADEVTWANIWAAVKRELNARIRSGKSVLKPGSEEYYRAVADRFRDIIDYTQVYDSVLSKSQMMRSKSGLARMMTSFMAEPTLSYNLVVNSFKGGTINGGRAIAAFAANVVLNTLLQSLVAALRDKEDISYWERYIKNVTESLTGGKLPVAGSEFNVFGNLPLVKDAISVMQGYDVPRTDMSLVTDAADVLKKLMKVTANREKLSEDKSKKYKNMTLYQEKLFDVLWDAGVMITNFTPLPMQSVSREIKGVINNVSHWAGDAEHYKTTSYTLRDAIKEGAGFGEDNPLKAYNALKNKEDEVLRRLKQSDSWQTWVRNGLKKYDRGDDLDKKAINRIEKAATANYSGNYDTYERLVGAIEKEGFDRNDILAAVESLVGDMRPKEEPDEPADKHLYTTKMLEDAIRQDNSEAVKDIKQKLKDVEGKTDDNIRSAVKKIARESYYEKGDEDGAIRVLRDYGDMSADEIKDAIDWFSYSVLNPDSELVYNSWQSWRSKASNGQINNGRGKLTAAQYEAYTQAVRGITGDDLDGDGKTDSGTKKKKVLAAINKLPLTKDQKNTLYLVNGYGKDSIGEAPWN